MDAGETETCAANAPFTVVLFQIVLMRTRFSLLWRLQLWQQATARGIEAEAEQVDAVLHWTVRSLHTALDLLRDPAAPQSSYTQSSESSRHISDDYSSVSNRNLSKQQEHERDSLHNTWAVLHYTFSCLTTRLREWRIFVRAEQLRHTMATT